MRKVTQLSLFVFLIVAIFLSTICYGEASTAEKEKLPQESLPLWEYGLVGLAAQLPHYQGSDEYQAYVFPLPYFVYRGDVIKADREGVRGIFWRNKHFETDISLSGNPPVQDDNEARKGMDDLDGLIEIGPALRYYFFELGERDAFFIQANIRSAFSFDFDDGLDITHEGNVAELALVYRNSKLFREQKIRFHLNGGFHFADADLHSYFYQVSPQFVTTGRNQYEAKGGYGGFQLSGSILKELTEKYWLGVYGKWMNSEGAVFEDSPLVRTSNNYVVAMFFTWKIGESAKPGN